MKKSQPQKKNTKETKQIPTVHTEIAKGINWKAIITAQKFKLQLQQMVLFTSSVFQQPVSAAHTEPAH